MVPSWNEKGTKLHQLDWPKNQHLTKTEIKKVPSWNEKGTKLMHTKVSYYIQILLLEIEPIPLVDLMACIAYKNRNTFRQNYLLPLQEVGFIKKTAESAARSPDQKYKTTPLGRNFLTRAD